jgi:short-subunit dehydrogenase
MNKKVSLVTGASSGLGRIIAEMLCEKGYKVYITARRKNLLEELKQECRKLGGEIIVISGDLSNEKFRVDLVSQIIKKEIKIDYLFNNAGFGRAIRFENQNQEEIEKMFQVNIIAYQHLTKLILLHMKKANSGRLIHIGSIVSSTPLPYFTVYNTTKSAVFMFNRSLKYELEDTNVTTTVVLPARMNTGFADKAFDCYKEKGRDACVKEFNKIAGSPYPIAKKIIKKMDKGKEIIVPTLRAKLLYFMKHFPRPIDFVMRKIFAPKQLKHIKKAVLKKEYKQLK